MNLNESVALVTGATSGIGRAAARQLAGLGIHVIISGRDQERGDAVVTQIRGEGGRADFVAINLHDEDSARTLGKRAVELGGRVDILVNNAGIYPLSATHETGEETFEAVYNLNVKVPYFLVAELAPAMVERGEGAIVNVTTMLAEIGMAGAALYGSSKAAVGLLTKAWSAEYGRKGVRVNAVSPGPTITEGTADFGDALAEGGPAGRLGNADEIADAITFLVSEKSSFIHGAVLPVDGGRLAV
jgi:NAD(P)-dependent dehydrogenase (short-subunit alcohol dehydrogenase family)